MVRTSYFQSPYWLHDIFILRKPPDVCSTQIEGAVIVTYGVALSMQQAITWTKMIQASVISMGHGVLSPCKPVNNKEIIGESDRPTSRNCLTTNSSYVTVCSSNQMHNAADTLRNNDVVIMSKRRYNGVITTAWARWEAIGRPVAK